MIADDRYHEGLLRITQAESFQDWLSCSDASLGVICAFSRATVGLAEIMQCCGQYEQVAPGDMADLLVESPPDTLLHGAGSEFKGEDPLFELVEHLQGVEIGIETMRRSLSYAS
jgi:hypothetical protein